MKLKSKIRISFIIIASMLLIAIFVSVHEFNTIGNSVKLLLDKNYESVISTKKMLLSIEREDSGILLILLGQTEKGNRILLEADKDFKNNYKILSNNINNEKEKLLIKKIERKYKLYKEIWSEILLYNSNEKKMDWYTNKAHKIFNDIFDILKIVLDINDNIIYNTATNIKSRAFRSFVPGIIALICSFILIIILNYILNILLLIPLRKIILFIKTYNHSKFISNLEIDSNDELFELKQSIDMLIAENKRIEK